MVQFEVVNMFSDRPFAGSALGVVPDAEGLSAQTMQRIATELNLPETAFVLRPSSAAASYRVRVFTPSKESPWGGHSSIGTASTLARLGKIPTGRIVQECGPKLLSLLVASDRATVTGAGPWESRQVDLRSMLTACGLEQEDVAATPRAVGFGPLFHYLPVRADAVARARLNASQMDATGLADVFVFNWNSRQRTAHARLFAPGFEIPEDPACSSVALGLGLWLVGAGWLPGSDGIHEYRIRQGVELGRPATLDCAVTVRGGGPTAVSVTGRVVPTIHGRVSVLDSPPRPEREAVSTQTPRGHADAGPSSHASS
jgi:trans-2,3-dihydro-3-hydroxyanthranilate isomerase